MSRLRELLEQTEAVAVLALGAVAVAALALPILLVRLERRGPR